MLNVFFVQGWVNDSEPEAEFQEAVDQSKAIHPPSRVRDYGATRAQSRGTGGDVCEA